MGTFAFANESNHLMTSEPIVNEVSVTDVTNNLETLNDITVDIVITKSEDLRSCSVKFTISNGSTTVSGTITADTCSQAVKALQLIADLM